LRTQSDGASIAAPHEWAAVEDPVLADWLRSETAGERELIVEARLPRRELVPKTGAGTRPVITSSGRNVATERKRIMADLQRMLSAVVERAVPLEAAGAIAVRATPSQVLKFIDSPLVKAVRANRRLRRSA
jgi:hypothetical protein